MVVRTDRRSHERERLIVLVPWTQSPCRAYRPDVPMAARRFEPSLCGLRVGVCDDKNTPRFIGAIHQNESHPNHISTGLTPERRARLEAKGWKVGNTDEFLGLTAEESALVDLTLALASSLRERRLALGWSQQTLAKKMGSSQSRVAKMELGVVGVTPDLLIRGLLAAGCSLEEVGQVVADAHSIATSQANVQEGTTTPLLSRAA